MARSIEATGGADSKGMLPMPVVDHRAMSALVWPLLQLGGADEATVKARRAGRTARSTRRFEPSLDWAEATWYRQLEAVGQHRLQAEVQVATVSSRTRLTLDGDDHGCWYGVLSGLVIVHADCKIQPIRTGVGFLPGTWFGESSLLQSHSGPDEAVAVCESRIAKVPAKSFHRLLAESKSFNCFVVDQLDGYARRLKVSWEISRLSDSVTRVARTLGNLFADATVRSGEQAIRITQAQVSELCCLSRPTVNQALGCLEQRGLIKTEYGGLRIVDLFQLQHSKVS